MKLRIQGNSVRFRLLRSEMQTFIEKGFIEETVHFAPGDEASFTYALRWQARAKIVSIGFRQSQITVILPKNEAFSWAESDQVGIYSSVSTGDHGDLAVTVEKDFACLDLSDAENEDTFPNPQMGAAC